MNTQKEEKPNHAMENARSWYENIAEWYHELSGDGEEERNEKMEELRERISELETKLEEFEGDKRRAPYTLKKEALEAAEKALSALEEFDEDELREELQQSPLSVQVRSGWTNPGEPFEAEEFEILLSTGGPALRIVGELGDHKEPYRAYMQYQDWGTPWTDYFEADGDVLLWFAQQFSYGY